MKRFDWSRAVQHFAMFTTLDFRVKMFLKLNPEINKFSKKYRLTYTTKERKMITE